MAYHSAYLAASLVFALQSTIFSPATHTTLHPTPSPVAEGIPTEEPRTDAVDDVAAEGKDSRASAAELAALDWSRRISRASTVIIATSRTPADALTSGALQGAYDAPLLYADPTRGVAAETLNEIRRLGASHAILLGGPVAVPQQVEHQLAGLTIHRIAGETRIETALAVAEHATTKGRTGTTIPKGVLLVRAHDPRGTQDPSAEFGDAIGAGALAAAKDYVVLLTPTDRLPVSVHHTLSQWPGVPVTVVGGPHAISDRTMSSIPVQNPTRRVAGPSRVETSVELARLHGAHPNGITVLDGYSPHAWAHGLAAALVVDNQNHVLVTVHPQYATTQLNQAMGRLAVSPSLPVEPGPGVAISTPPQHGGSTAPSPSATATPKPPVHPTTRPAPPTSQPEAPQPPATPPVQPPAQPSTQPSVQPSVRPPVQPKPRPPKPTATPQPTSRPTTPSTPNPPAPKPPVQPTAQPSARPTEYVIRDTAAEALITSRMNQERARRGLAPVKRHPGLDENARAWTRVMLDAGDIWHADDWAEQIEETIRQYPNDGLYWPHSENVIMSPNYGKTNGAELFESWHTSSGHAANMYSQKAQYMGLAVLCSPTACYGTQRFVSSR